MIEIKPRRETKPDGSPLLPDQKAVFLEGILVAYLTNQALIFIKSLPAALVLEIEAVVENQVGDFNTVKVAEPDPRLFEDEDD